MPTDHAGHELGLSRWAAEEILPQHVYLLYAAIMPEADGEAAGGDRGTPEPGAPVQRLEFGVGVMSGRQTVDAEAARRLAIGWRASSYDDGGGVIPRVKVDTRASASSCVM